MSFFNRLAPVTAPMLALLMPGLGQLYAGRRRTAVITYTAGIILYGLIWAGMYKHFIGLLIWLVAMVCYYILNIVSAFIAAQKTIQFDHRTFGRLAVYFAMGGLHLALFLLTMTHWGLPVKLYHIPSPSMAPALQIDDYFVIERNVNQQKIERGDIVVFTSPTNENIVYVKRVVGLSGEVVEIFKERVWINGTKLVEPYLNEDQGSRSIYGFRHYGPLAVPDNSIYVLGDNRSHSTDSRQYKSVELKSLKGKALYVIWAADKARIGTGAF